MVILLILCYSKVVFCPRSLMDKTGTCGVSDRGSIPLEGIILKVRPVIRQGAQSDDRATPAERTIFNFWGRKFFNHINLI